MTVFEDQPADLNARVSLNGLPLYPENGIAVQNQPGTLVGAVAKGFVMGIPETLVDYVNTIRQTGTDVKQIKQLEANRKAEIDASGQVESRFSKIKRGLGKASLIGWYASVFPAYQLFDDAATYPLYLHLQEKLGSTDAYGLTAVAVFGLAAATGLGQRSVETAKANLRKVDTSDDTPNHGRRVIDALVNSSMWQVALSASKTREAGEAVPIVNKSKVAQYAGAYAIANTALYAGADSLPVGEWTGFGISLALVWALGGSFDAVKQHLKSSKEFTV